MFRVSLYGGQQGKEFWKGCQELMSQTDERQRTTFRLNFSVKFHVLGRGRNPRIDLFRRVVQEIKNKETQKTDRDRRRLRSDR